MDWRHIHAGRIILALILSAGASLVASNVAHAEANPARIFCGTLTNGDVSSEHVTTLRLRPDKLLSGEYTFADGEAEATGTLKEVPDNDNDPLTVTLRWTDPYGSGLLVVRFDSEYTSFDGKWGEGDKVPDKMWFGDPCR